MNLRNFNPRKILFFYSFSYKAIFALSSHSTEQKQSGVKFYEESYGFQDETAFSWFQKFYMINLEKVKKNMKIQEYLEKI